MIKIEDWHQSTSSPSGRRYRLVFSDPGSGMRGWSIWAETPEEVHEALNHYWRYGPRLQQHIDGKIEHCPLCRQHREETQKKPKLKVV